MANAKIGGTWRTVKLPYARVSGTWRPCKQMYAKVNGVWKIVFDLTEPDPFDGSGLLSDALTPGYVPWEVVSGTWTKSGGNVSSSDASDRVAAVETGLENIEVEIDRTTAATGGDGVAFWIQDQSNWWGVRAYTEEYFVPFSGTNYTYYPRSCIGTYSTRNVNTNPSVYSPGNLLSPGTSTGDGTPIAGTNFQNPGNSKNDGTLKTSGTCTATTGCTGTCCFNAVSGTFKNCYWTQSQPTNASNTNRYTSVFLCRTCSCSGSLNNNCTSNFAPGGSNCPTDGACATTNYPTTCTVNNKGNVCRVSSCGAACGTCTTSGNCLAGNNTATGNNLVGCPAPSGPFFIVGNQCTCTYNVNYSNTITNNQPTNNPPTFNNPPTNNPPTNNSPTNNPPNNNPPTNNPPNNNPPTFTPASCTCSDSGFANFPYLTNIGFNDSNISLPGCSNTQPCTTNNPTGTLYSRTCVPCSVNTASCTTAFFFSGANAAYYKRGQIVRKSGGTLNVITSQDFGDVGNLYVYTSGNNINFRQYSSAGRAGTASNLVTYDAGNVQKQTKHGILVTAVPYTQSYSISRFKVTI